MDQSREKLSLRKHERLKKRDDINLLFSQGESLFEYPIKLYHLKKEAEEQPILFGVSVPKKKFKKAVDRNLIKRRIREAYRLHQKPLKELFKKKEGSLLIMPVYIADEIVDYQKLEGKIILLLQRLHHLYEQDNQ